MPIGMVVNGANRHDMKLTEPTLESVVIRRPEPTSQRPWLLCLEKGYDYDAVRELVEAYGYNAHIPTLGEKKADKQGMSGYRARRWVVERTHFWMNRFRRGLIRWEKDVEN